MKRHRSTFPTIETLESRIAPAGLIAYSIDHRTATWTDVDGDKVTLFVSKGRLADALFTTDQTPATGLLVTKLDLTGVEFAGANVRMSAARDPLTGGDNAVNLGYLDATGHELGAVTVGGDLGRIDAGIALITAKTPKAIGALNVFSMGTLDGATLPAGASQTSEIVGKVGAVKVRGSVQGVLINVTGGVAGSIDALTIGGSLIGTGDADSGRISTSGKIGAIFIKDSIVGGAGQHSGSIEAGGAIRSLTLGGSLLGGRSDTPSTDGTGVVRSDAAIGGVRISGSIHGGTQQDSGLISAAGNVGTVSVLGGIVGGSGGTSSGGIFIGGNVGSITVKGDVLGGAALDSGTIAVSGKSGAVVLLGALTGGAGDGSGTLQLGTDATDAVGRVSIARDVTGGGGEDSGRVHVAGKLGGVRIIGSLHGAAGAGSGAVSLDLGAGSVSIGGDIAGGSGVDSGRVNASDAIAALTLGGNLLGGVGNGSGSIVSTAKFDKILITGGILGGDLSDTATADLVSSGIIQAGRVGSLEIRGAILAGGDFNAAHKLVNNASIRVQDDIQTLTIKGGIQGTADTTAFVTARGQAAVAQDQTTDVAFGKITIGGTVRHAGILAGYNTTTDVTAAEANPNAQIGEVAINGDWIASDLVAGAKWNDNFGNGADVKSSGVDNPDIVAQIAKISVTGAIAGTGGNTADRFGFIAQEIVEMKIGPAGTALSLNTDKGNDNDPASLRYNLGGTMDVRVFEFA